MRLMLRPVNQILEIVAEQAEVYGPAVYSATDCCEPLVLLEKLPVPRTALLIIGHYLIARGRRHTLSRDECGWRSATLSEINARLIALYPTFLLIDTLVVTVLCKVFW